MKGLTIDLLTSLCSSVWCVCFCHVIWTCFIEARTPSHWPWKDPVGRAMSQLNLALQCTGLMRQKIDDKMEALISSCNSIKDIRAKAEAYPELQDALKNSIESTQLLVNSLFQRLKMNDKYLESFSSATGEDIR